jgi:hydrogenase maturation protease
MSMKVIAIGNVLMKDDAIGIEVAKKIGKKLEQKNIEVFYGETDIQYSISNIKDDDYLFVLDAACYGKHVGEITCLSISAFISNKKGYLQHNYNFLDLLKIYNPKIKGKIFAIKVKEVDFGLGLSIELQEKLEVISEEIINKIEEEMKNI